MNSTIRFVLRPMASAAIFTGTVLALSYAYAGWSTPVPNNMAAGQALTKDLWNNMANEIADHDSKISNFTFSSGNATLGGTLTASNVNQAPILSTTNQGGYYATSSAGWQYIGTSATVTVPAWPNRKYRISSKAMGYGAAGNYMFTTVSTSSTSVTGTPTGMGSIYEYATDTGWHTTYQEGYADLAPGTYTFYLMAYGGTSYTINYHNNSNLTNIMIWPL